MKTNYGIWIDGSEAFIIPANPPQGLMRISSGADFREREEGEGKRFGRFGDQFLDHERKKERRLEHQLEEYMETIVASITDADGIVVFGPSTAKTKLQKAILEHHDLKDKLLGVETADNMTTNQMKAWVREYYEGK